MTTRLFPLLVSFTLSFAASNALAEDKAALANVLNASLIDMPITTSPASIVLGANGEKVPRLQSFRAFASGVSRAYDEKGELANAVAVEIAPALALGRISWDDIVKHPVMRAVSRTSLSFATKVGKNSDGDQTAIGLQTVLFSKEMDEVIKVAATVDCRAASLDKKIENKIPGKPGDPPPTISPEILTQIANCQKKIDGMLTKWNQSMVAVGLARSFRSEQRPDQTKLSDSSGIWITASFASDFGQGDIPENIRIGQMTSLHVRKMYKTTLKDASGNQVQSDQTIAGINFRYGNGRMAGIAEYSKTRNDATAVPDSTRYVLGLEYRIAEGSYLTLGGARDSGKDSKNSLLANLNFGFGKSSIFGQ